MPGNELDSYLASLIQELPQVVVTQKFGHANFTAGKRVFGFTKPDGLVLKLPAEKAKELVGQKKPVLLVMGKRVMKEWVILRHPKPAGYKKDLGLIKESIKFVSSKQVLKAKT